MGQASATTPAPLRVLRFQSSDELDESLGVFGLWVGPRTGPNRRTQAEKETYVARRLIVALVRSGQQQLPFELEVNRDDRSVPDFVIVQCDGTRCGLEITEAGDPSYQAWLTRSETDGDPADSELINSSIEETVDEWVRTLEGKSKHLTEGAYSAVPSCDLAIYDNTKAGDFLDMRTLAGRFRARANGGRIFNQVHVVRDLEVCLDILGEGNKAAQIHPLSGIYSVDYAGWLSDQVERLRSGMSGLDAPNIAEELRDLGNNTYHSLRSQLKRILIHLYKWKHQPSHRTVSWEASIDDGREKVAELISTSPSLRPRLPQAFEAADKPARRQAAIEMGLGKSALEDAPGFSLAQTLDPDFLPDAADDATAS
jgi:hypothetical protein